MKISIKNFFKIKEACIEGKGAHFIAGPGSSGKTTIKQAIAWGLTGKGSAPLSAEVTIENDCISIKRTVSADGGRPVIAISKDTGEILEIQDALGRMGFNGNTANIYTCDIGSALASDSINVNTPSTVVLKNGKSVDISTLNIEKCEAAYKQLLAEKETTSLLIKGLSANKEKLIADMEKVKKELIDLKAYAAKQKAVNDERIFLSLMERMECPLYSLQCEVDAKLINTAIEDKKAQIEKLQREFDAGAIKDAVRQIEWKERELISIEERLKLLEMPDVSITPSNGDNHPTLTDRMKELLDRIEDGRTVLDAARKFKAFCSDAIKVNPEMLSVKGAVLGINVTMKDGHLTVNAMPYEQASMTEKTLALFSVQEALRAPIIICDDIYGMDAQSRGRLIKHAVDAKPEGLVLFLGTKSEKPLPARGVTCWFVNEGILEAAIGMSQHAA